MEGFRLAAANTLVLKCPALFDPHHLTYHAVYGIFHAWHGKLSLRMNSKNGGTAFLPKNKNPYNASVRLLQEKGPALGRPHVDTLSKMSKHSQMKELRIQHAGDAYRVLFAFDPKRNALLLLGDRKPDQKWYKQAVPKADKIFDEHLAAIEREQKEKKKEQ